MNMNNLPASAPAEKPLTGHRVLIADDEPSIRHICRLTLEAENLVCDEVVNGVEAMEAVQARPYDLILLDMDMPEKDGREVCRRLRENPPQHNFKIILVSGGVCPDELAQLLLCGADDYLTKPFTPTQLQARVQAALRLKTAQDRSDLLYHTSLVLNRGLEQNLNAKDSDLIQARNALVLALATLAEKRDEPTGWRRKPGTARLLPALLMTTSLTCWPAAPPCTISARWGCPIVSF